MLGGDWNSEPTLNYLHTGISDEVRTRLRHQGQLVTALLKAEAADRAKTEFLANANHELRTPLTAIYGWARMLVTGQIREDQKRRAIETIGASARARARAPLPPRAARGRPSRGRRGDRQACARPSGTQTGRRDRR